MNLDSKLFDATLDLERVKVSVRTLVKLSRQEQSAIIRTLNEFGFLLLRSEQGEDRQELLALKELFGRAAPTRAPTPTASCRSAMRGMSAATSAPRRWSTSCTPTALSSTPRSNCAACNACATPGRAGDSAGQRRTGLRAPAPAHADQASRPAARRRPDHRAQAPEQHPAGVPPERRGAGHQVPAERRGGRGGRASCGGGGLRRTGGGARGSGLPTADQARAGEILVLDNTAVLHGRTAFCANELREMRRLNFDGHGRLRAELELGFKVGL